jgi:DNA-directed RNA polymerase subunit RPC12/RpoP
MSLDHDLIRDALVRGVAAAKSHSIEEARYYLEWVLNHNPGYEDRTQALLWLTEVTTDDKQRRAYLEDILTYDPAHPTARRGLAILDGRLREEEIIDPEAPAAPPPAAPQPVESRRFVCPRCGGVMQFDPQRERLVCQYCGHSMTQLEALQENPLARDEDFFVAMAKAEGHHWQQAGFAVKCQGCGATTILPAGQISTVCPFCNSPQVVRVETEPNVIEPTGIIPFQLTEEQALARFRAWLGGGWFRPSDLVKQAKTGHPRAVYVPYWAFNFLGNVHWTAQVLEGQGRYQRWVSRSEDLAAIEDGILVPATHSLPAGPLRVLDEFDLSALQPYAPEMIASWPAEIYQVSMADASIVARQKISQRLQRQIDAEMLAGASYRSLNVSTLRLGVDRFQHILLPVWVFSYRYKEKVYHVLVNGQTGETEGEAPTDETAVGLTVGAGLVFLIIFAVLLIMLLR